MKNEVPMYKTKINARFIIIAILIFSITESVAADDKAEDIIKDARKKYEDLKTLKADFTQIFQWKLAENVHEQKGMIWLKGKDKFKIQTDDQIIVSDGKTVWTYSAVNNQVIVDNVDKSEDITLPKDLLLNYSKQYVPKYIKNEKVNNTDCHLLEFTADTQDIFIKYMKIWINTKLRIPVKIQQTDLNDNINTYMLSGIEIDTDLPDNFFKYQSKPGVEVIDMR